MLCSGWRCSFLNQRSRFEPWLEGFPQVGSTTRESGLVGSNAGTRHRMENQKKKGKKEENGEEKNTKFFKKEQNPNS